jgi:hypothetical protein
MAMESVILARSQLALDHKRLEEHTRYRKEGTVYSRGNHTSRKRSSSRHSNGGPRRRSRLPREGSPAFYRRTPIARRFARKDYDIGAGHGDVGSGWWQGWARLGQWRAATGARRFGSARGRTTRGDKALGAWTSVRGLGTNGRRDASASRPRGVPQRARARCGASTSCGRALEHRVKTNSTYPSLTGFFSKNLNCSAQKFE